MTASNIRDYFIKYGIPQTMAYDDSGTQWVETDIMLSAFRHINTCSWIFDDKIFVKEVLCGEDFRPELDHYYRTYVEVSCECGKYRDVILTSCGRKSEVEKEAEKFALDDTEFPYTAVLDKD